MNESPYCLISLSAIDIVSILNCCYSDRCVVISHFLFLLLIFNSLMKYDVEHQMFICHLCIFFEEMSVQIFCWFFKWVCMFLYCWVLRVICIFWIQVLFQKCVLQNFLLSVASLHFLNSVFWKDFYFDKSNLSTCCSFMNPWFGVIFKKPLPSPRSNIFPLRFSSGSFIILNFTFDLWQILS